MKMPHGHARGLVVCTVDTPGIEWVAWRLMCEVEIDCWDITHHEYNEKDHNLLALWVTSLHQLI